MGPTRRFNRFLKVYTRRFLSTDRSLSSTLLLPKTTFPLWSKGEERYRDRTCDSLYRWQEENVKGPLFVLHDGPPYANGDLHMGHALNKIIKDIINRFHLSQGRKIHYVPGWDCHGLPIENKALKELGESSQSLSATTIRAAARATAEREIASQREQFRQFGIMADWTGSSGVYRTLDHEYEMRQLRIFQDIVSKGLIYRDYKPVHYSPSSLSALAEGELVYVDDHVSHSVFVTFRLVKPGSAVLSQLLHNEMTEAHLLVWTTTPWTLSANMGIAVNTALTYLLLRRETSPELVIIAKDRLEALSDILGACTIVGEIQGTDLLASSYAPIFSSLESNENTPLAIIPSTHVTNDSGTGLVHCAPAHGAEDYALFKSLDLLAPSKDAPLMICHVDHLGKFSPDIASVVGEDAASSLVGQDVLEGGSKAVVTLLRQTGALVAVKRWKHRYPYDWKTDKPIIVTATEQWFANLSKVKRAALSALKDVTFFPAISRNRLETFVKSRSEWCISRQRVWGVPIPSLHHIPSSSAVLNSTTLEHILSVLDKHGSDYWWTGPIEDFIPPDLVEEGVPVNETWKKGTDTMDVWFDSGSSWSMLRDLDANEEREFYADVCLEGSDQHRGWFQSQLLTAVASAAKGSEKEATSPYGTVMTHGMVLDAKSKKMSKSLGNVMSPITVVQGGKDLKKEPAYGADVLRLWAASVDYWRDMSIGPTVLSQSAESLRKIRNSTRFMLGNIGTVEARANLERVPRAEMGMGELYVMHELYTLEQVALEGYASYEFPKVVTALNQFATVTLSSLYLDISKDSLYADEKNSFQRRSILTVLEKIVTTMTSIMAPILPHLAEEIHETMHASTSTPPSEVQSVFKQKWSPLDAEWKNVQVKKEMDELLLVRGVVMETLEKARRDKKIKSSLEADVSIVIPEGVNNSHSLVKLLRREENLLKTLFIVSDALLEHKPKTPTEWFYDDTMHISGGGYAKDLTIRVRSAAGKKCPRCWAFTRIDDVTVCPRCTESINL